MFVSTVLALLFVFVGIPIIASMIGALYATLEIFAKMPVAPMEARAVDKVKEDKELSAEEFDVWIKKMGYKN